MPEESEEGLQPLPPRTNTIIDLADLLNEDDDDLYQRKRDRYLRELDFTLKKEKKHRE